eukprot:Rhum_TRINITY_DN25404_c0_g1::Rhum_TRINITY_DN25404_c0_g1_i1::g.182061::m.182061
MRRSTAHLAVPLANKYSAQGTRTDQFPVWGPHGNQTPYRTDWAEAYKAGPKKSMRLRKPKKRKVASVDLLEMTREEASAAMPYEEPVDNQKVEAAALRESSLAVIGETAPALDPSDSRAAYMPPPGVELETDPHRPQRRVFRTYQNFEVEHFPAASQADYMTNTLINTYRDFRVHGDEQQLCIPQSTSVSLAHRRYKNSSFGHHNLGWSPIYNQSPAMSRGSQFWAKKGVDRFKWQDPLATSWDSLLDEPTNPLHAAPHGKWLTLPLNDEVQDPTELRTAESSTQQVTEVEDFDGTKHEFATSSNQELDALPVSTLPQGGKYSKMMGMPIQKTNHVIQYHEEEYLAEKLVRAEKWMSLYRDEDKEGEESGQDMRILCIGDSLTIGLTYGNDEYHTHGKIGHHKLARDHTEKEVFEHPYAKRLHELTNAHVDVLGVVRDTTDLMRDRLWRRLEERQKSGQQYDLVVIWGGVYDLFDPDKTGESVAQNLIKMHHVCHMHGCKTVAINMPHPAKGARSDFTGTRTLEVNDLLKQFADDRRKNMAHLDIYSLMPPRSSPKQLSRRTRNGQHLPETLNKIGFANRSGWIEFTPNGYDRVAELVFKTLKHKPHFLQKALGNRFYPNPTTEPNPDEEPEEAFILDSHLRHFGSRRRTYAHSDCYGSVMVDKNAAHKVPGHKHDPISEEQEQRLSNAVENSLRSPAPLEFGKPRENAKWFFEEDRAIDMR